MDGWRKSTYSDANGGQCLETASAQGQVLVRDTTDRDGVTLSIPAEVWQRFTSTLR
jgi:Domain of unknown function (DUF397)